MIISCAEPDKGWGRRPCEGFAPSNSIFVSCGLVVACRTHPGLDAAWRGSNVADRFPRSYGGQHFRWSEQRKELYEKYKISSPATASEAPVSATVSLDARRQRHADSGSADVLDGVTDAPLF